MRRLRKHLIVMRQAEPWTAPECYQRLYNKAGKLNLEGTKQMNDRLTELKRQWSELEVEIWDLKDRLFDLKSEQEELEWEMEKLDE